MYRLSIFSAGIIPIYDVIRNNVKLQIYQLLPHFFNYDRTGNLKDSFTSVMKGMVRKKLFFTLYITLCMCIKLCCALSLNDTLIITKMAFGMSGFCLGRNQGMLPLQMSPPSPPPHPSQIKKKSAESVRNTVCNNNSAQHAMLFFSLLKCQ